MPWHDKINADSKEATVKRSEANNAKSSGVIAQSKPQESKQGQNNNFGKRDVDRDDLMNVKRSDKNENLP